MKRSGGSPKKVTVSVIRDKQRSAPDIAGFFSARHFWRSLRLTTIPLGFGGSTVLFKRPIAFLTLFYSYSIPFHQSSLSSYNVVLACGLAAIASHHH